LDGEVECNELAMLDSEDVLEVEITPAKRVRGRRGALLVKGSRRLDVKVEIRLTMSAGSNAVM
jgi:hypothetical protein